MYVQCQEMPIIEMRRAAKATRSAGDSVTNVKKEQPLFAVTEGSF
jgi:hypothetical protein